jgi:hypothetical protein
VPTAMAIRAQHDALLDLRPQGCLTPRDSRRAADVEGLLADVMEIQHDRIKLPAVDAPAQLRLCGDSTQASHPCPVRPSVVLRIVRCPLRLMLALDDWLAHRAVPRPTADSLSEVNAAASADQRRRSREPLLASPLVVAAKGAQPFPPAIVAELACSSTPARRNKKLCSAADAFHHVESVSPSSDTRAR